MECAAFTRSKAGLNRCGHPPEKAAGQAIMIPQDEGERPGETAQAHGLGYNNSSLKPQ
jgi:hypothetical protein